MKLQIAFDHENLEKAIDVAHKVHMYADIIEIGTPLLYHYGIRAIETFRKEFKDSVLLIDSKINDRASIIVPMLINAGADWITLMAGINNATIASTAELTHKLKKFCMLDLLDSASLAQSALTAESLGIDALMYHMLHDDQTEKSDEFINQWETVSNNTKLPIFIAPRRKLKNLMPLIHQRHPAGLIIGSAITDAEDPVAAAQQYHKICHG
jgi:3-keto-L-gulonate-6-phosphate decarboxylase